MRSLDREVVCCQSFPVPSRRFNLSKPARRGGGARDRFIAILVLVLIGIAAWKLSRPGHGRKKQAAPKPIPVVETSKVRVAIPAAKSSPAVQTNSIVSTPPVMPPVSGHPRDVLEAQIALVRQGISCGSLDGVIGSQTRAALRTLQRKIGLPETGALDTNTRPALIVSTPSFTTYTVTSNDLMRLQPVSRTWLGKSQQSALDYETILELVAEKSKAHPKLIQKLNPGVSWTNVLVGTTLTVPDAEYPAPSGKAAFVRIRLGEKTLEACDANTNLLAHFPCSIAQRVEKRPAGELHVTAIAPNPNYTFNPEIFPEVPEARTITNKLIIQPGPNNPVGTVWISLDLPGYGMHGTPKPEDVGRTESHGCFRLANWNAEYLLKLVWVGMPVFVEQ